MEIDLNRIGANAAGRASLRGARSQQKPEGGAAGLPGEGVLGGGGGLGGTSGLGGSAHPAGSAGLCRSGVLGGGESGEGGHLGAKAESRNGSEYAADAGGESGAGGLGGGDQSSVTVSADTIALIASKAAQGVDGILALDAGFSGGVAEALGRKDAKAPRADKEPKTQRAPKAPGVKISVGDNEITLSINVVTAFGARIPEVAWNLQERVKNSIEELTGIRAIKVNVLVTGVRMP